MSDDLSKRCRESLHRRKLITSAESIDRGKKTEHNNFSEVLVPSKIFPSNKVEAPNKEKDSLYHLFCWKILPPLLSFA